MTSSFLSGSRVQFQRTARCWECISPHPAGLELLAFQKSASASQHTIQKEAHQGRLEALDLQREVVTTGGRLRCSQNIEINLHLSVKIRKNGMVGLSLCGCDHPKKSHQWVAKEMQCPPAVIKMLGCSHRQAWLK